jgi:dihydroxyacetone kinase
VAGMLLDLVLPELPLGPDAPAWVLVNTLGATPLMEALIVLRAASRRLDALGIPLHAALAGEYITSLEMAGLSLTVTAADEELARLLAAPARGLLTPALGPPW